MCVGIAVAATIDLKAGQARHSRSDDGGVSMGSTEHAPHTRRGSQQQPREQSAEHDVDLEASHSQDVTDSLLIRSRSSRLQQ